MLSSFEKTEDGEYVYPDEYAGAYLKDNTLCINLTDMSEDMLEKYRILCGDSCRIDFNLVDHSYAELLEAYEIISTSEVDNLTSVSVDIKENQIDVGIADEVNANANTSVQNSLNVISLNEDLGNIPVSVTHEDYWTVATETLKGGTHGSVDAILLCGHSLARGSQIVLAEDGADAIVLGSVVRHQFADGEKYDCAVAELYSTADVELTNLVKNNASTTGTTITSCATTDDLLLNTTVCKYGKNGGFAVGTVSSLNYTATYDINNIEYRIPGIINVNCTSGRTQTGDSGGPIYVGHTFYGVLSGFNESANTFGFTPIYAIPFTVKVTS